MRAIEIDNIKKFTNALFAGEVFDSFCVTEASFSTLTNITIDGHINQEFMGEAELQLPENKEKTVRWKKLRPLCYDIIKGQKVPLRFRIIFMMPLEHIVEFIEEENLDIEPLEINALFLNVKFENNKLVCTTGTSLKVFTLDKSLEDAWDSTVARFLNRIQE